MKQREQLILQMEDKSLRKHLVISQLLLLLIAFIGSVFVFDPIVEQWRELFSWDFSEIVFYGVLSGLLIAGIEIILIVILPTTYYDDGGINYKLFHKQPIFFIFFIALLVAIAEELLFRGLLQTTFGYISASIIFAVVHIRYLKKPVLLISVVIVSFYLGYLFYVTENLIVTIVTHFLIDSLLGLFIRFKSEVWKQ